MKELFILIIGVGQLSGAKEVEELESM